jgi:hypothetical protein
MKTKGATITPHEYTRRFVVSFVVSFGAMVVAMVVFLLFADRVAFDFLTGIFVTLLIVISVFVGFIMVRTGEQHAGMGVLFGALFGLVLTVIGVILLALALSAMPAGGFGEIQSLFSGTLR